MSLKPGETVSPYIGDKQPESKMQRKFMTWLSLDMMLRHQLIFKQDLIVISWYNGTDIFDETNTYWSQ